MISRIYVTRQICARRADLTPERINELIDDAVRLLGNLTHYKNGGIYEDEDVIMTALLISKSGTDDKGVFNSF